MHRISRIALSALFATTLQGALIRGTVAENATGNSLAGALILLQPIGPNAAAATSIRANDAGNFEFPQVPAGSYIVRASRRGFLPLEYGQRQWNSAGTPVKLSDDSVVFLNIRLHRLGAITGLVRDENEVGMAGHDVVAYRKTEPPQLATRAKSDDRGVYRVAGLEPGMYLIRTTGNESAEASYIPTFSKQTLRVEDAQQVRVYMDEDSKSIDVHPAEGKLFTLEGAAAPVAEGYKITVTLASDMGRRTVNSVSFSFAGLPAGAYEVYAEARAEGNDRLPPLGGWAQVNLSRDLRNFSLAMREIRDTQFDFSPRQTPKQNPVSVIARRKDLAGPGEPYLLKLETSRLTGSQASIPPGRYEMIAIPPDGSYVTQFSTTSRDRPRPDGWVEETLEYSSYIRIGISGGASALHGIVKLGGEPVEGAPVFLEAWDPQTRKRLVELRSSRADSAGHYAFTSLAPGVYRVMSTFEYLTPDSEAIDLALPHTIFIEPHSDHSQDLDLYGIR